MQPIKPMEPVLYHEAFDDPAYLYQVKWDGVRSLAYTDGGVRLINKHLNERTEQYPEIACSLTYLPDGTVLDGELVALGDGGKPDFYRVMKRELARGSGKIAELTRRVPAFYMVFDIIAWGGEDLTGEALQKRQGRLTEGVRAGEHVQIVESVPERGRALFDTVEKEDLEGIVAKRGDSPYLVGVKSELWKKIKVWRTLDAWVGGWSEEAGRIRSLALGIEEEGLLYIGNVGTGFSEDTWKAIGEYLRAANPPGTVCPFVNRPRDKTLKWARPELVARVRYREIGSDGRLRHPVAVNLKEGGAI